MADTYVIFPGQYGPTKLLVKDNGDGTFSLDTTATLNMSASDAMVASLVPAESLALFNETTLDRARSNTGIVLLPSAARTTTQTSADLLNVNGRMLQVIIDVTIVAAGPSVTVTINGKDPASGKYYPLLTSAAIVTAVTTVLRVGPGLTAAANLVANDFVPRIFQIVVTANNVNSGTYSVGYNLNQ